MNMHLKAEATSAWRGEGYLRSLLIEGDIAYTDVTGETPWTEVW